MNEQIDGLLVHCYTFPYTGDNTNLGPRNLMQDIAAAHLSNQSRAKKLFLAGGYLWGENNPSMAKLQRDDLVARGVNYDDIPINPKIKDTSEEVDLFLEKAAEQGWNLTASLANKKHARRIEKIYRRRGLRIPILKAEDILWNIEVDGEFPHRAMVERFGRSTDEWVFGAREAIVTALTQIGLESQLKRLAQNEWIVKIKSQIDS